MCSRSPPRAGEATDRPVNASAEALDVADEGPAAVAAVADQLGGHPLVDLALGPGSTSSVKSEWLWMSTKPGATTISATSSVSDASPRIVVEVARPRVVPQLLEHLGHQQPPV